MRVIENATLRMRWFERNDATQVLALLNDPAFISNIADRGVRTHAQAIDYIEHKLLGLCRNYGYGLYVVESCANGVFLGTCGLVKRDNLDAPDVGYALLPAFRGKGIATQAVALTLLHAQQDFDLSHVYGIVNHENTGSQNVLRKCGFFQNGEYVPEGEAHSIQRWRWQKN